LGINWKWHDSAAALVDGTGQVWACAEEERYTRVKHAWETYPIRAVRSCLRAAGITWRDLDVLAIGFDLPRAGVWHDQSRHELFAALFGAEAAGAVRPELVFVEHHLAHAISTFHASGFDRAGVLVVDGAGELEATSIYAADRDGCTLKHRWSRSYSLGAMYEAATRLLGFGYLDAGKTMGLAPYGEPDGALELPFDDAEPAAVWQTNPPLGLGEDAPYDKVANAWMDYLGARLGEVTARADRLHTDPVAVQLAVSAQRTVEARMRSLHAETVRRSGHDAVCLAGGVALNCVANGQLNEPIYILPAPHDGGVSLGAAWSVCPPKRAGLLPSPYLGSTIEPGNEIDQLRADGYRVGGFSPSTVVQLLADGAIGAIAQGRAEIGPRALGHRSIVALPAPAGVRDRINKLKGREPWRPLAPVTLPGYADRLWPSQGLRELYMVGTARVSEHAHRVMPAAAHVDGTTRPQVLHPGQAPVLESLLRGLEAGGLPPVLINTSFNSRGEPIVDNAADAVRALRSLRLDFLVLGDQLVLSPRCAPSPRSLPA
jgi:carbamoyltransferase